MGLIKYLYQDKRFDDKRHILKNGINTLAYGHKEMM